MSWIVGNQKSFQKITPEQELERQLALEGFLEEDQAKRELFLFFKNNISIASSLLMGVDLYPYQQMIIKTMMDRDYVLNVLGRGSAKSYMAAVFAGLYAMMYPNSKIGILSSSFRQSKHIFKYVESFASKKGGALFKDCIKHISKRNDDWTMEIGSSTITAVPLGDGDKLRGFRFTVILIDELLLMPSKILNEVILPFISVVPNPTERDKLKDAEDFLIANGEMKEEDRYVWPNNKLIGLSSASYAFEYLYELYQVYDSLITGAKTNEKLLDQVEKNKKGGASRAIFHMSYEAMPSGLYEQSAIEQFKATMSESQFDRELRSIFTDDSSGFFRVSKMKACTIEDGMEPSIELKGDPAAEYIVAIDPSWAENDSSDDFAIQVLKLDREKQISVLVHSYAVAGGKVKQHIEYFLYILTNFNIVMVWADYAGGLQFINSCNESEIFKKAGINLGILKEEFENNEDYKQNLANGKKEYNLASRNFVVFRKFSADWIRKGNELLQANFDHKKIWFGARCFNSTYEKQIYQNIPIDEISFIRDDTYDEKGPAKMIDFLERQHQLVDLTKAECALIQVKSSPQGGQVFDLPENIKRSTGANRTRKDSYTALLIGNWGTKIYFDMLNLKIEPVYMDFTPSFIG